MIITNMAITVSPSEVLKHSRQNRKKDTFTYRQFENKKLCVVDALNTYLGRRNQRVSHTVTGLFITNKKPFHTLRRWVKQTLTKAGIYNFSPHSCRSASTSKASSINIDLEEILKKACWSNAKTFRNHYQKEIIALEDMDTFQNIAKDNS